MKEIIYKVDIPKPVALKDYLMREKGMSHRMLTKLKRQEMGITRDGKLIRSVDMVQSGDEIRLLLEDTRFLEANNSLCVPVAYESESLAVFDKPVEMPVHPSIKHQGDTLGNFFSSRYPDLSFRPINRLDRDTSGLCAVAKNAHAAWLLQNSIEKTYYAVVCGKISGSGTIDAPIARLADTIILRHVSQDGQRAVTHYETLEGSERYTLLKIKLETGRTHQIRVHFSHIGFPLAGDDLYGGSTEHISHQALHCGRLMFKEPLTGERITVKSEPREDMLKLLKI